MSLCQSIDTLSMAFLDDELAAEERRELELHLLDCASCRHHVDGERDEIAMLRKALTPPPAPELVKARITRALDAEDAAITRHERRRWARWMLPGSAITAAAAAIVLFVGLGALGSPPDAAVALSDVAKQQNHPLPFEVQGASTGPWLRANFAPVELPRFAEPGIALLGARLLPNGIANHDAALLSYLVTIGNTRLPLTAVVLKDPDSDVLSGGQGYQIGGLVLWVHNFNNMPAVSYIDPVQNIGYVFASERLTAGELLQLVASPDLITRAKQTR
jgi:anti-sigma factor RsiW